MFNYCENVTQARQVALRPFVYYYYPLVGSKVSFEIAIKTPIIYPAPCAVLHWIQTWGVGSHSGQAIGFTHAV